MDRSISKQYSKVSDKSTKELLERETLKCELIEEMYSKQIDTLMKQIINLETQLAIKNMQSATQVATQTTIQHQNQSVQQPVTQYSVQPASQHPSQPSIQILSDQNTRQRKSSVKPPPSKKPDSKTDIQKPKINWPNIDDIPDDPELKKSAKTWNEDSGPINLEQTEHVPEEDTDHEDIYYTKN